jgi:hypothetical protein
MSNDSLGDRMKGYKTMQFNYSLTEHITEHWKVSDLPEGDYICVTKHDEEPEIHWAVCRGGIYMSGEEKEQHLARERALWGYRILETRF